MADKVEFPAPKGFVLPEGAEPGQDFDLVCTLRTKENGNICLVQLGDVKMPGYDNREGETKKQDYSDYVASMRSQMSAGAEGGETPGSGY